MNCTDARPLLPLLASDDLSPEEQEPVRGHVAGCAACAAELAGLRRVLALLDATPAPAVAVDVAAVYRRAAAEQAGRLRRWRRLAAASAALAAAAVLLFVFRGLELRCDANQMTLRWGRPPAAEPAPPPPVADAPGSPKVTTPPVPAPSPEYEERLRLLNELVRAQSDDARRRDLRNQAEVARLEAELRRLRQEDAARWAAVEQDVRTMYQAQFLTRKGNGP